MTVETATKPETDRSEMAANDATVLAVRGIASGPRDAAAEPPWPQFPLPEQVPWERFARFINPLEGHIVAGRLNVEGVPAIVEVASLGFDFSAATSVWVPKALMHRARWILAWEPPSEAELTFLATGEMGADRDDGSL